MNANSSRPVLTWWDAVLAALGGLVLLEALFDGIAMNVVNLLLIASIPVTLAGRVWAAFKGNLETGFVRRPFASEHRWFLVQALVRWGFLGVWVLVLRASIVPLQLGDRFTSAWTLSALVLLVVALFPLFPKKRILTSRLLFVAAVTLAFALLLVMAAVPPSASEVLVMDMPFRGEMVVFQGGSSPLINHHFVFRSQRNALDLLLVKNGKVLDGVESDLASHACFGQPIYAPLSGAVVKVVNDRPDMTPGTRDEEHIAGNHVVLQVGPERFIFFAHLKQGSVQVHEGELVACGKVLAECGNSGNTSAPHLHLHVQDHADFTAPDLRTYPIAFRDAVVARGSERREEPTTVRRNDRVKSTAGMCR